MTIINTINEIKHVNAEITRGCNLLCDYCFNSSGRRMPDELNTDDWKRVLNISKGYGAKSALFTGGEVMTRPDASEILSYSLDRGVETSILSNGYRVPQLSNDLLKKLSRVQISLDSASPISHDTRRGNGSWKVAREAIEHARLYGVPVEISTTLSFERLDELEGIAGIAYLTGSKVLVRPLQNIGRALNQSRTEISDELSQKHNYLRQRFGDIFVDDFAKYVPILGEEHDITALKEGFITILPNGIVRGSGKKIFQLSLAA
ncbi:MAG: radical SAM protein [Nanoarchaeota archaeon]